MAVKLPHPEYFEGVLQLRPALEKVLAWVLKKTKQDAQAVIVKEKAVAGGIDLYFSSQRYLVALGKKLHERFPGTVTVSRKLHTLKRITSRPVYRVTVLYRALDVQIGQVVELRGEKHKVISIGQRITTKNVMTGKKQLWKVKEFQERLAR